jgi:aerobic carbon-monoxide dehydrogenase large subunit
MSILGNRVLRKEDPKFLTTGAVYTADLVDERLAGAAYVTYVRSTVAAGRIVSIEVDEARTMPGVLGVFTADDAADLPNLQAMVPLFPPPMMTRPWLAKDAVRFVGEPVVAIVAETSAQGADAAEAVFVDYEPTDAIVDLEAAAEAGATLVHPEVGTNVGVDFVAFQMMKGVTDDTFFDGCDVVVRQRIVNNRVAAAPLEGRSAAAAWDGDSLVYWMSNQSPHGIWGNLQKLYDLTPETCRVIIPDVGGGFGLKLEGTPEEMFLPWLAKQVGRPVRWAETRTENMTGSAHGRDQVQQVAIGGTRDGKVLAYRIEALGGAGAYCMLGGFLPFFTHLMASGVYDIPKIETAAKSVVTNTAPVVAFRGAGRPEATAAIERAMDLFAAEIGMDPVDVRRRNLIAPDAFPFTTAVGAVYDTGDYERSLDLVLEHADYAGLRKEQARRREAGDVKQLGIGVAVYVEITSGPSPGTTEWGKVVIHADGSATIYSGSMSHGQSHATAFAMLVSEQTGIEMDRISLVQGDTAVVPKGTGTNASKSLQAGGSAVYVAAGNVVDRAREIAAELLEASADDVVLDKATGAFHVQGTPAVHKTWAEVAAHAGGQLDAETDQTAGSSFPFGTHLVLVEVDTETGEVEVARVVTCDDAGKILNPILVEGQRHGGIAQGIAQSLLEEVRYDEDGNPLTSNFADYGIIATTELPSYELLPLETPTPNNPLGAKGIGESGAIGSTPALQSAIVDALSHLGVRHIDIPASPQKVWATIAAASA